MDQQDFKTLSEGSRNYLLSLVRRSIGTGLDDEDIPGDPPDDPLVHRPCGAFVTLKKGGALRGCIGRMESSRPLWETVAMMARAAAFEDPRFPPVTREELEGLSVEISVLTPFQPLEDPLDVRVGTHGLLVEKGIFRGVLLPQVATEQGWTAEEFLRNVCLKASLPEDAWKDPDVKLSVFSAVVFGDVS
jgi:AmmeMemoRadiSam system protein A